MRSLGSEQAALARKGGKWLRMDAASSKQAKELMQQIVAAYPSALSRAYGRVRFEIINEHILAQLNAALANCRDVLDIGCGFGLLGCFLCLSNPALRYLGLDVNPTRIRQAQQAARALNLSSADFRAEDATTLMAKGRFDAILMVDLLHHIPDDAKRRLLQVCWYMLSDHGVLVIKDVNDRPWPKLFFTWLLDVFVTGGFNMRYWGADTFQQELKRIGFCPDLKFLPDRLPYPHILLRCTKTAPAPGAQGALA